MNSEIKMMNTGNKKDILIISNGRKESKRENYGKLKKKKEKNKIKKNENKERKKNKLKNILVNFNSARFLLNIVRV